MYRLTLVGLFLLLSALAVPHLDSVIWADEQRTLYYLGALPGDEPLSLAGQVERIAENRWQAPLYYVGLRGWSLLGGTTPFALRVPSWWAGLLALAVIYRLVGRRFSREMGVYAAVMAGASAFYLHYTHEMRVYALLVLLVAVFLHEYDALLAGRRRGVFTVALSAAALAYAHYFTLFLLAAAFAAGLGVARRIRVIGAFVAAGVLFLPWTPVLLRGASLATGDLREARNLPALDYTAGILTLFSGSGVAVTALLLALALTEPRARRFAWIGGAAFAGVLLATRFVPVLTNPRYALFLWPLLALLAAVGMSRLGRLPARILLVLWIALAIFPGEDLRARIFDWHTPPYDVLTAALGGALDPGDTLLYHLPAEASGTNQAVMDYYFDPFGLARQDIIRDPVAATDADYARRVTEAADGATRLWITYETDQRNWRLGPVTEAVLPEAGFLRCETDALADKVTAFLFVQPERATDAEPFVFQDADGTTARVYRVGQSALFWESDLPQGPFSLGVHTESADGVFLHSTDRPLTARGCAQLPASDDGQLQRVTVYAWETGARLVAASGAERPILADR